MFPKTFSQCTTGLANILTWERGIFSMQRLQLIKYTRLSEEQYKLRGILRSSPVLQNVLQKLITRTDIVIKQADKGKAVVVLDTEDYKKECYRQLNDPKFYKKIKKITPTKLKNELDVGLNK